MQLSLQKSPEELKEAFYQLESRSDVANLLEITEQTLIYYLYRLPPESQYTIFELPKKSGGVRMINAPSSKLKIIQRKLNQVLQAVYVPRVSSHGFVSGRSIITNAQTHMNNRRTYVFNIDLKDFFPSINLGRVRGMFMAQPYGLPEKVATILAQICCYDGALPQGAPTSPIISNMICVRLDNQLLKLAKDHKCTYTRYADDITFSTAQRNFPVLLAEVTKSVSGQHISVGKKLTEIINENGFEINAEKVRLSPQHQRQEITGITVNKNLNVTRRLIKQIGAMLHAWEKYGLEEAETEYHAKFKKPNQKHLTKLKSFQHVVRGKIAYLGQVRDKDKLYSKFLNRYYQLADSNYASFQLKHPSVFISYSSQDAKFAFELHRNLVSAGISTWIDKLSIPKGMPWPDAIQLGLEQTKILLLIKSPTARESKNVSDEWQYFIARNKLILPLNWTPVQEFHFQIDNLQHIDFHQRPFEEAFKELLDELRKNEII